MRRYLISASSSLDSSTPSWLNSPSPLSNSSNIDKPLAKTDQTGLRPITSLSIPSFADLPTNQAGPSRQPFQGKRLPSPEKSDMNKRKKVNPDPRNNGIVENDVFAAPFPKHNGFRSRYKKTESMDPIEPVSEAAEVSSLPAETEQESRMETNHPSASNSTNTSPNGSPIAKPSVSDEATNIHVTPALHRYSGISISHQEVHVSSSDVVRAKTERQSPEIKQSPQSALQSRQVHQLPNESTAAGSSSAAISAIQAANKRKREKAELELLQREAEMEDVKAQVKDLCKEATINVGYHGRGSLS